MTKFFDSWGAYIISAIFFFFGLLLAYIIAYFIHSPYVNPSILETINTAIATIVSIVFSVLIFAFSNLEKRYSAQTIFDYAKDIRIILPFVFTLLTLVFCIIVQGSLGSQPWSIPQSDSYSYQTVVCLILFIISLFWLVIVFRRALELLVPDFVLLDLKSQIIKRLNNLKHSENIDADVPTQSLINQIEEVGIKGMDQEEERITKSVINTLGNLGKEIIESDLDYDTTLYIIGGLSALGQKAIEKNSRYLVYFAISNVFGIARSRAFSKRKDTNDYTIGNAMDIIRGLDKSSLDLQDSNLGELISNELFIIGCQSIKNEERLDEINAIMYTLSDAIINRVKDSRDKKLEKFFRSMYLITRTVSELPNNKYRLDVVDVVLKNNSRIEKEISVPDEFLEDIQMARHLLLDIKTGNETKAMF